jgi:DNA-directed RNA polymerase specialized sigma54-like protein
MNKQLELTDAERDFILAAREGRALAAQTKAAAEPVERPVQPKPEPLTERQIIQAVNQEMPDTATRIAAYVVGHLVLVGYVQNHVLDEMHDIVGHVAVALSQAIQEIDPLTLNQWHEGRAE